MNAFSHFPGAVDVVVLSFWISPCICIDYWTDLAFISMETMTWAFGGHADIVRLLLNKGADVNAKGGEYSNALEAAQHRGHVQIVTLLLGTDSDAASVMAAQSNYSHAQISRLLGRRDHAQGNEASTRNAIAPPFLSRFLWTRSALKKRKSTDKSGDP